MKPPIDTGQVPMILICEGLLWKTVLLTLRKSLFGQCVQKLQELGLSFFLQRFLLFFFKNPDLLRNKLIFSNQLLHHTIMLLCFRLQQRLIMTIMIISLDIQLPQRRRLIMIWPCLVPHLQPMVTPLVYILLQLHIHKEP